MSKNGTRVAKQVPQLSNRSGVFARRALGWSDDAL